MGDKADAAISAETKAEAGPRAILRVTEVLMAVATRRGGGSLAELSQLLKMPKTSLHRILRTLEQGGFLVGQAGVYLPGPESFRLAEQIRAVSPTATFPACARPEIERLAAETGETVTLGVASEAGTEIVYVDVIESEAALRYALRIGSRRPLYAVASGKVILAFAPEGIQRRYLSDTPFERFTSETTGQAQLAAILREVRGDAVVIDRNGFVDGASAVASPVFDRDGGIFCAVSVAGPTERIMANRAMIRSAARIAGERISRILGYSGAYPPARPGDIEWPIDR